MEHLYLVEELKTVSSALNNFFFIAQTDISKFFLSPVISLMRKDVKCPYKPFISICFWRIVNLSIPWIWPYFCIRKLFVFLFLRDLVLRKIRYINIINRLIRWCLFSLEKSFSFDRIICTRVPLNVAIFMHLKYDFI